ncbi:hypothetical protein HDV05_000051 [Chytridiales sp. JEL 0842]|nr:hypothetical protein HDV05_000051 [Chytridiales sp. JEL 0842]
MRPKSSAPSRAKSAAHRSAEKRSVPKPDKPEEGSSARPPVDDTPWVDRITKELRAQREWNEKWGFIKDSNLYMDNPKRDIKHKYQQPTKWSAFSIINAPTRNPVSSRPDTPDEFAAPTFKVTGSRDHHLSPTNPHASCNSTRQLNVKSTTYSPYDDPVPPAHEQAPFATSRYKNRATLSSYNNAAVVGGRGGKHTGEGIVEPMQRYVFPATNNMEYGWNWGGRKSLELFGSTSANFTRESWKRPQKAD